MILLNLSMIITQALKVFFVWEGMGNGDLEWSQCKALVNMQGSFPLPPLFFLSSEAMLWVQNYLPSNMRTC